MGRQAVRGSRGAASLGKGGPGKGGTQKSCSSCYGSRNRRAKCALPLRTCTCGPPPTQPNPAQPQQTNLAPPRPSGPHQQRSPMSDQPPKISISRSLRCPSSSLPPGGSLWNAYHCILPPPTSLLTKYCPLPRNTRYATAAGGGGKGPGWGGWYDDGRGVRGGVRDLITVGRRGGPQNPVQTKQLASVLAGALPAGALLPKARRASQAPTSCLCRSQLPAPPCPLTRPHPGPPPPVPQKSRSKLLLQLCTHRRQCRAG